MAGRKGGGRHDEPLGFPEMTNPGVAAEIERPRRAEHPFDGDEHGHDRHDTLPAEEEWVEDSLRPDREHNPHDADR